jgi:MFS family permease
MIARNASSDVSRATSRFDTLKNNLRCSVGDGGCWGAMVGFGEHYIPAFALAAGLGEVTAGWIASLPILAGGILQTVSLRAISMVGSYQRWIAISCTLQALAFFPLVFAAYFGYVSAPLLFFLASVYWGGGLAAGPAWNTWMGHIVPSRMRPTFFARRSRTNQLCTLASFLAGGLILHTARHNDQLLIGFALLFFLAGTFRLISVWLLLKHQGQRADQLSMPNVAPPSTTKNASSESVLENPDSHRCQTEFDLSRGYRLVLFLAIVQGMVQFSGPYFTPFMLKHLSFSYAAFVAVLSASFIAKAISMPIWGYLARKRGARWLLWTGAISIVPLASMWNVSDSFFWLLCVQAASGTAWAAYELGFFLMFFDTLPTAQRTRVLTHYNLANTTTWFCGSLLGGWYLASMGATPAAYHTLFLISTLGRLLALGLLWNIDHPFVPTAQRAIARLSTLIKQPRTAGLGASPALSFVAWKSFLPSRQRNQLLHNLVHSPLAPASPTIPTASSTVAATPREDSLQAA